MDYPPHKSGARETGEAIASAVVSLLPAGGALQVLLDEVLNRGFRRRSGDFLWYLADGLNQMQEKVDGLPTVDELGTNEAFLDAVFQATRAAQATHSQEKLTALRNAVLNSVTGDSWDEVERARFLRIVDEFTPVQLRMLVVLHDPRAARAALGLPEPEIRPARNMYWGELDTFPEFRTQEGIALSNLLLDDLRRNLLIAVAHERQTMYGGDGRQTTDLGERFLQFISAPDALRHDR